MQKFLKLKTLQSLLLTWISVNTETWHCSGTFNFQIFFNFGCVCPFLLVSVLLILPLYYMKSWCLSESCFRRVCFYFKGECTPISCVGVDSKLWNTSQWLTFLCLMPNLNCLFIHFRTLAPSKTQIASSGHLKHAKWLCQVICYQLCMNSEILI